MQGYLLYKSHILSSMKLAHSVVMKGRIRHTKTQVCRIIQMIEISWLKFQLTNL
jgi:hypothetical protein